MANRYTEAYNRIWAKVNTDDSRTDKHRLTRILTDKELGYKITPEDEDFLKRC